MPSRHASAGPAARNDEVIHATCHAKRRTNAAMPSSAPLRISPSSAMGRHEHSEDDAATRGSQAVHRVSSGHGGHAQRAARREEA